MGRARTSAAARERRWSWSSWPSSLRWGWAEESVAFCWPEAVFGGCLGWPSYLPALGLPVSLYRTSGGLGDSLRRGSRLATV